MDNDIMNFNSSFISSYKTSDSKFSKKSRLVRYHYASASTFPKILSDSALRFTDVRFMNDHSEMVCCVKCLLDFLDAHRKEYPYCWEVVSELLLKKHSADEYRNLEVSEIEFGSSLPEYIPTRCFAFCMSEKPDLLNMWNYYVHNGKYEGYSIGFDVYDFLKSFDTDQKNTSDPICIRYGKILYKKKEQVKEIETIVKLIEQHPKRIRDNENGKLIFNISMARLRHYIEAYGAFFKDEAFEDEREFRIVIEISENRLRLMEPIDCDEDSRRAISSFFNHNLNSAKRDFFVRNGVLVPFLSVPINKNSITKITMSPMIEHKLAERSLSEFLKIHGYKAEIEVSKIPIRF